MGMTDTTDTALDALVKRCNLPWPENIAVEEVKLPVWVIELLAQNADAITALRAQVADVTAQFVISEKDRERLLYLVAEERRNVLLANIARESAAYARGVHAALSALEAAPSWMEARDAIRALADAPPALPPQAGGGDA
jgi:hypothetical protein